MALKYGTNFLASDIAKVLEKNDKQKEGIRTWSQLFGNASLGFGAQSDAITSNYASAMREAYTANFNQRNKILTGGLSQGYTQQALGLSQQDLSDIYERFVTNYSKDINTAAQSYGSEVSAISGDLTDRAENFSKLFSSAYDYLSSELYGSTLTDITDFSDPIYTLDDKGKPTGEISGYNQRQLDYLEEKGLDWLYRGEGEERRLMTWEEASDILFDEAGELTEEGVRFYDQMFNARPEGYLREDGTNARSFDKWLSDTDAELRDWWQSADDFNYNFAGTNRGTANIMTGRESTDFKEDVPDTTLLNAKRTGYSNFVKKMNSLEKIGKTMNKQTAGSNKEMSYDDWFDWVEKNALSKKNFLGTDTYWGDGQTRAMGAMTDYIKDYETSMNTQMSTFRTELENLLGSNLADEFWRQFGGDLYEKVSKANNIFNQNRDNLAFGWNVDRGFGFKSNDGTVNAYNVAKSLRDLDLDKEFTKLQQKLQEYINESRSTRNPRPSGF